MILEDGTEVKLANIHNCNTSSIFKIRSVSKRTKRKKERKKSNAYNFSKNKDRKNGESDLNDIIFRTLGALGISMKREVAKNDIRL